MNVHIIHDGAGAIASVHRTVDGAAHHLAGHAQQPVLDDGTPLSIEDLDSALDAAPIVRVSYEGTAALIVERHAVVV